MQEFTTSGAPMTATDPVPQARAQTVHPGVRIQILKDSDPPPENHLLRAFKNLWFKASLRAHRQDLPEDDYCCRSPLNTQQP